jgi:hypothetical protein
MNKRCIWVLSAALLGGLSLSAIAGNHGMERHGSHQSYGQHVGGQGTEAQLAQLETVLKLDDAQRPAWKAFSKDIQDIAQARKKQHEGMREAKKNPSNTGVVERMDVMAQMLQVRQAHLATMKQATQTLMSQLKPEQQTVFNAQTSHLLGAGHGHHEGRRGEKKQH